MNLHFSMFFQRGTGAVAGIYEDGVQDGRSEEYPISNITFFRGDGKTTVEVASTSADFVRTNPTLVNSFRLEQPAFIRRRKNFSAGKDEKAFLWMQPGGKSILCLEAEAMQLTGPKYIMLGTPVDKAMPFEPIARSIAEEWGCGVWGASFQVFNKRSGSVEWYEKKAQFDSAVLRLKAVETEEEYKAAIEAVEKVHQELVALCEFWSEYTVEDYIQESCR